MIEQEELTTYIALFHHRDNAASAIRELEKAGFTRDAVTVIGGGNGTNYSDSKDSFGAGYGYGAEESLAAINVPVKDRKRLQDGLAEGGTVVTLKGSGERANEIEKIFDQHSTKKIDETTNTVAPPVAPVSAVANTDATVIPLVQEELVVGKREVDRGGVRVHQRVVETPVTDSVNLREEHVVIERRPVDRAVTQADLRGDQTIELSETAEEAVVGKTARVVEEVRVGKQATDHTETITDTVRHTEVEIEQIESNAAATAGSLKM